MREKLDELKILYDFGMVKENSICERVRLVLMSAATRRVIDLNKTEQTRMKLMIVISTMGLTAKIKSSRMPIVTTLEKA